MTKGYICCNCRKPISLKNENCIGCGEPNLYVSIREVIVKSVSIDIDGIRVDVEKLLEQTSSKHDGLGGVINQTNLPHLKWWIVNKLERDNHEELKIMITEVFEEWIS
jgi:hypothetical protein